MSNLSIGKFYKGQRDNVCCYYMSLKKIIEHNHGVFNTFVFNVIVLSEIIRLCMWIINVNSAMT